MFDSDAIFYHFLVGSVSSLMDGVRRIKTSYGYTQVTPSEITTGRISSANGLNYIDLKQDEIEIKAKVSFTSNSPAIQQVTDAIDIVGINNNISNVENNLVALTNKANVLDDLGTLAFENSVEKAMLGNTLIDGGYIKTELLNSSAIVSNGGGVRNEQLQNAINSLIVGGRNYILNSKRAYGLLNNDGQYYLAQGIDNGVRWLSGNFQGKFFISTYFHLLSHEYFTEDLTGLEATQSVDVKPTHDMWIGLGQNEKVFCEANEWTRLSSTSYNKSRFYGIYAHSDNAPLSAKIYHRNWKLEKGNKATDWTPAPEDVDAQFSDVNNDITGINTQISTIQSGVSNMATSLDDVKEKTDNFTSIQGGLVTSNIISVGDTQVSQNAFLSGVTDAGTMSVRFGAGANYENKENAPFRVLDNGTMVAEKAEIKGGEIAKFKITGNTLSGEGVTDANDFLEIKSSGSFLSNRTSSSSGRTSVVTINNGNPAYSNNENNIMSLQGNDPYNYNFYNALMIDAKGTYATALNIKNGKIKVDGQEGVTTDIYVYDKIIKVKKGIIVGVGVTTPHGY